MDAPDTSKLADDTGGAALGATEGSAVARGVGVAPGATTGSTFATGVAGIGAGGSAGVHASGVTNAAKTIHRCMRPPSRVVLLDDDGAAALRRNRAPLRITSVEPQELAARGVVARAE